MIQSAPADERAGASFEAAPRRLRTKCVGGTRFQAKAERSRRSRICARKAGPRRPSAVKPLTRLLRFAPALHELRRPDAAIGGRELCRADRPRGPHRSAKRAAGKRLSRAQALQFATPGTYNGATMKNRLLGLGAMIHDGLTWGQAGKPGGSQHR